jgi:hypothetical protein
VKFGAVKLNGASNKAEAAVSSIIAFTLPVEYVFNISELANEGVAPSATTSLPAVND